LRYIFYHSATFYRSNANRVVLYLFRCKYDELVILVGRLSSKIHVYTCCISTNIQYK